MRTLRIERNLTQANLARAVSVSRQTVNAIETERYTPSLPLAFGLASFFDMPIEEIFDGDEGGSSGDE